MVESRWSKIKCTQMWTSTLFLTSLLLHILNPHKCTCLDRKNTHNVGGPLPSLVMTAALVCCCVIRPQFTTTLQHVHTRSLQIEAYSTGYSQGSRTMYRPSVFQILFNIALVWSTKAFPANNLYCTEYVILCSEFNFKPTNRTEL